MEKERIIIEIEEYAKEHDVPIMEKEGLDFLLKYIKEHNVKSVLEIGSAIGYSASRMALVDDEIMVKTIEIDELRYNLAKKNIADLSLEKQIDITLGDALLWEVEGQYDLIFIDAAKAQYVKFFERYAKNLSDEGVIVSDNLSFHGYVENPGEIKSRNLKQLVRKITKYIEYLKGNEDYETDFYELGDGIAVSRKRKI